MFYKLYLHERHILKCIEKKEKVYINTLSLYNITFQSIDDQSENVIDILHFQFFMHEVNLIQLVIW